MKVDVHRITSPNLGKKNAGSYLIQCIRINLVEELQRKHEVLRSPFNNASSVLKSNESGLRGIQWHRMSSLDEYADQSSS